MFNKPSKGITCLVDSVCLMNSFRRAVVTPSEVKAGEKF